eukprot:SAG11_NODE_307_length_10982_cov_22.068823_1_plen_103_part_10
MQKFSHADSLSGNQKDDCYEFLTRVGAKIIKNIQPNRRCQWLVDAFGDDEQRILNDMEAQHFIEHGVHFTFDELVATACWRFKNPDSLEKLTNRFHAMRQGKT